MAREAHPRKGLAAIELRGAGQNRTHRIIHDRAASVPCPRVGLRASERDQNGAGLIDTPVGETDVKRLRRFRELISDGGDPTSVRLGVSVVPDVRIRPLAVEEQTARMPSPHEEADLLLGLAIRHGPADRARVLGLQGRRLPDNARLPLLQRFGAGKNPCFEHLRARDRRDRLGGATERHNEISRKVGLVDSLDGRCPGVGGDPVDLDVFMLRDVPAPEVGMALRTREVGRLPMSCLHGHRGKRRGDAGRSASAFAICGGNERPGAAAMVTRGIRIPAHQNDDQRQSSDCRGQSLRTIKHVVSLKVGFRSALPTARV